MECVMILFVTMEGPVRSSHPISLSACVLWDFMDQTVYKVNQTSVTMQHIHVLVYEIITFYIFLYFKFMITIIKFLHRWKN